MKKWIFAIVALVFMACGDDDSDFLSSPPKDVGEEDDGYGVSSSSGKMSSSRNASSSSSSKKGDSSSSSEYAYVSTSEDTSSYLHIEPTRREFAWRIENSEMVLDLKKMVVTDKRDGRVYEVDIEDSAVFMAQNLAYETLKSWCYNDYELNCEKYGRLYTYRGALSSNISTIDVPPKGACPLDWKVATIGPSYGYGGRRDKDGFYTKLTKESWYWWREKWEASMDVIPSKFPAKHSCVNSDTCSQEDRDPWEAVSVRCEYRWPVHVPDSVKLEPKVDYKKLKTPEDIPTYTGAYGEVVDVRDGNVYKTVAIGDQVWFAENLRYKKGICFDRSCEEYEHLGRLYRWNDATGLADYAGDSIPTPYQGVCPMGWHIPTMGDWQKLVYFVLEKTDGVYIGRPLLSTDDWGLDEPAGTNSFGFNVIPAGGAYESDNYFWNIGLNGDSYYLMADDSLTSIYWYMVFKSPEKGLESKIYQSVDGRKYWGHVRCIKGAGSRTIIDPAEDDLLKDATSVDTTGIEPPADPDGDG